MTLDMVCAFGKEELIKIKQNQSSGKNTMTEKYKERIILRNLQNFHKYLMYFRIQNAYKTLATFNLCVLETSFIMLI
jgi:hypothetical protein